MSTDHNGRVRWPAALALSLGLLVAGIATAASAAPSRVPPSAASALPPRPVTSVACDDAQREQCRARSRTTTVGVECIGNREFCEKAFAERRARYLRACLRSCGE